MNRPDKAGEPSMEEILASIRQIIADDSPAEAGDPEIAANPLVPQAPSYASAPKPTGETRVPLADRLSGVLKNGALPPTSPLGSKRPLSFDQDLADMFDEPVADDSNLDIAPKPAEIRVPPSSPILPSSPVIETAVSLDSASALPPQLAPSQPLAPPMPFGGSEKHTEAKPPEALAPTTFGFPPLRKASFYPPQPKTPAAPASPAASAPSPTFSETPAVAPAPAPAPRAVRGEAAFKVLGAGVPQASAPIAPQPIIPEPLAEAPFVSAPFVEAPFVEGGRTATPYDVGYAGEPPLAVGVPPYSPPPQAQPSGFATYEQRPINNPAPMPSFDVKPAEPHPYDNPYAAHTRPAPSYAASPSPFASGPQLSTAAAHQALDALAQGLAASAAHTTGPATGPAEPLSPAIPLTPIIDMVEQELRASPPPSTLPAAYAPSPVNRTLEDAVADMLRPMLQQWVADNMPRIIERALRNEVATSIKPGQKP
ncbi:MAG: DUF2497 domain-containing protein [Hyphomicrobium sp.]|uniref:DUF2497 domain-containing protein n=1 Tax=Hyphomicrobium sp. TaxID=82 RepID=UPI003D122170